MPGYPRHGPPYSCLQASCGPQKELLAQNRCERLLCDVMMQSIILICYCFVFSSPLLSISDSWCSPPWMAHFQGKGVFPFPSLLVVFRGFRFTLPRSFASSFWFYFPWNSHHVLPPWQKNLNPHCSWKVPHGCFVARFGKPCLFSAGTVQGGATGKRGGGGGRDSSAKGQQIAMHKWKMRTMAKKDPPKNYVGDSWDGFFLYLGKEGTKIMTASPQRLHLSIRDALQRAASSPPLIIMQENALPSDSLDDFLPSSLPALVAKASSLEGSAVHQHTTFKFLGGLAEARTPLPRDVTANLFPVQLVSTEGFQRLRLLLSSALLFSTTVFAPARCKRVAGASKTI